jgi:hypothetical protein
MKHWFFITVRTAPNRQTQCIFNGITTPEFAVAVAQQAERHGGHVKVLKGKAVQQLVYETKEDCL